MATWADTYLAMIYECEKRHKAMTPEECDFVADMRKSVEDGNPPTSEYIEYLNQLRTRLLNPPENP